MTDPRSVRKCEVRLRGCVLIRPVALIETVGKKNHRLLICHACKKIFDDNHVKYNVLLKLEDYK